MSISPGRRLLFVAATAALPVVFFCLVEVGLRLGGFGSDYPAFVELEGYPGFLIPNPEVGRRYFARTSVVPEPMHDAFQKEKRPETLRLIVQGASTAAGFPYGHGGSFSRMLQQRLQGSLPGHRVEVVNTSMAAVNSFTLLDLANEIIDARPDAVLIYAGHNEYYGALGVGSTESLGPTRRLVRLYLAVDHLRVVQALRRLWASAIPRVEAESAEGATLMQEMARDRAIPLGGSAYRAGLLQFEENLTDLLCRYDREGIPVFIGTLVSNEGDQPPFESGMSPETDVEAWRVQLGEVEAAIAMGDTVSALGKVTALIEMDDASAQAYFIRGRLNEASGKLEEARLDFKAAKDRDGLRFRAPEEASEVIRKAADACGAHVVEVQRAFAENSSGRIPGDELLLEHVHPNVAGYFLVADAFYRALAEREIGGRWEQQVPIEAARAAVVVTPLDSVLASLHVRRLKNNWPFQPPGVTLPDTFRVASPVEQLALDVLKGSRSWLSATAELGAYYETAGDYDAALLAARALIAEEPYRSDPYVLAGNLMLRQSHYLAALRFFEAADRVQPSVEARRMMGHTFIRAGRMRDAIPWLRRALEMDAENEAALYDLGVACIESGETEEARSAAERLLRINSRHEGALRLLAHLEYL